MGAEDYLGILSPADLAGFTNQVQQRDPFGFASRSLAAWQPDTSTWNATESGLTSFGRAFLSGIMQNYASQNAANQLNSVIGVLPQLKSDPMSVAAPQGVDADAFAALKGSAILKNYIQQSQEQELQKKFNSDLLMKLLGKKAEVMGEAQAYDDMGQGGVNPNSPAYKVNKEKLDTLDTIRDKFNKLPEVTAFSQVQRAASAMAGALKDKGGPSDLELVRYAVQMIEPGMAVREGEQQAVLKSGSIPDQWKGELNKSLENGTAISDTVREGLKRLASRAYEAQKSSYDKALTYYQGLGEGRGLLNPGESISYLGEAPPSESVFGAISPSPSIPAGVDALKLQSEANELRATGKYTTEQIAKMLREKYSEGMLGAPRG